MPFLFSTSKLLSVIATGWHYARSKSRTYATVHDALPWRKHIGGFLQVGMLTLAMRATCSRCLPCEPRLP